MSSGVFLLKDNDKMEQTQSERIKVVVKNMNGNGILLQNAKGMSLKSGGVKAEYILQVEEQDANVDIQQAQFVAIENECVEGEEVDSQFVPLEMVDEGQIIIQDKDVILWDELCRICANTSDKVIPIFSGEGLEHNLCKKIQNYLPLTVSETDTLPLQVCYNCAATLLAWHEMTQNCLGAQERLIELQNKLNSKNQEQGDVSDGEGGEIIDNETEMEATSNQEDQVQAEADQQDAQVAEHAVDESEIDRVRSFSYVCGVCEAVHDGEIELMKHVRADHREQSHGRNNLVGVSYECNVCARSYASKSKLVRHLRMHERGAVCARKSVDCGEDASIESSKVFCRQSHRLLFKCEHEDCGATLKTRRGFLRHMRVHRDERPVICEHCGKTYRIEDDLKRHIDDVHHKIKRHQCDICGRSNSTHNSTASFKDFRKRYKPSVPTKTRKTTAKSRTKANSSRSSNRVSKIKTEISDDQTSKEKDDLMPVKKEEDSDDDYFEIEMKEEENATTKSASGAKRARRKQKLASPKNLECKQCSKAFQQRKSYDIHMRQHTGEKPFTCHICGKQFGQTGSLYYHLKHLHGGVKNHACDICGRCFAMKTAMEDHRRIHTGERPYVCDVCGKTFKTKASLYIHSKIHTDEYPFNCSYCEKPFRWKQQMISHLTTHTGEKNHICDICNKGFGVKNELTRHRRTHSTDKPFTCQKCGLSFGQKRYLTNHNRTRHKIKAELNVA